MVMTHILTLRIGPEALIAVVNVSDDRVQAQRRLLRCFHDGLGQSIPTTSIRNLRGARKVPNGIIRMSGIRLRKFHRFTPVSRLYPFVILR